LEGRKGKIKIGRKGATIKIKCNARIVFIVRQSSKNF
jgi:hypothetical protein